MGCGGRGARGGRRQCTWLLCACASAGSQYICRSQAAALALQFWWAAGTQAGALLSDNASGRLAALAAAVAAELRAAHGWRCASHLDGGVPTTATWPCHTLKPPFILFQLGVVPAGLPTVIKRLKEGWIRAAGGPCHSDHRQEQKYYHFEPKYGGFPEACAVLWDLAALELQAIIRGLFHLLYATSAFCISLNLFSPWVFVYRTAWKHSQLINYFGGPVRKTKGRKILFWPENDCESPKNR